MSVPHFLLAVLLIPFVLVLASQLSVTIDSWGHQRTENLTKDHAAVDTLDGAVDALDDHSELKLSAFCFFYRHALVHPAVGMIAVEWHQICATWENVNGEWKLYKDGNMENTGTGFKTGYVIQAEGSLVLGQEQDSPGGTFDRSQSFQGSLANLNVWSYVLPESTIKELSGCCHAGEGNVYTWSHFIYGIRGNPRLVIPSTCKCVY